MSHNIRVVDIKNELLGFSIYVRIDEFGKGCVSDRM